MDNIKIKKAIPQKNLHVLVEFNNGVTKKYNVRQLFAQFPDYKALEHVPLFNQVYVDCGGCSIAWTPDIDISEWELWDNGTTVHV
jgi:hypothetical protein